MSATPGSSQAAPVQAFVRSRKGSVGMIFSLTALPAIALVIVADWQNYD